MRRVFTSIIALRISSEAAPVVTHAPAKTLTMPVESGFVSLGIDDQNLDLLLESGFWGIAVLDGDWYKKTFGKYACRKRRQGCYFCPREDPCVFEGDESSENLQFADGKILKCIMRSGKLVLESQEGSEFPFRVCRGISWDDETRPTGIFGISMAPPSSEPFQGLASTESTLEMLVRYNFTGRRSYTIQTTADRISKFISGELTLGGALDELEAKQHSFPEFAVSPETHRAFAAVWVSSVELFEAGRKLTAREPLSRRHPPSFLAIIDTGTSGISLPCPVIIDEMESGLRMGLRKERYGDEQITQMYMADEEKLVYVQEEAFDSLPVMGLRLRGESHSMGVDIHPKHYCGLPEEGDIFPDVTRSSKRVTEGILGTPFLRAYSVHVDYEDYKIALLKN